MIFLVILIFGYFFFKKVLKDPENEHFYYFICAFTVAILVDSVVFFGCIMNPEKDETISTVIEKTEIVALQDNNSVSGRFFLGCGMVDGEMSYSYYHETDLGITYDSISAEDRNHPVYIKYLENSEDQPHILRYGKVKNKVFEKPNCPVWISILSLVSYSSYEDGEVIDSETYTEPGFSSNADDYRYEIWIPKGTILEEYELDLQ